MHPSQNKVSVNHMLGINNRQDLQFWIAIVILHMYPSKRPVGASPHCYEYLDCILCNLDLKN